MFVFTVEDCTFEGVLKFSDGLLGDMIGDLLLVLRPKLMAEVSDVGMGHGRKTISFGPGFEAQSHLIVKLLLGRKYFVG